MRIPLVDAFYVIIIILNSYSYENFVACLIMLKAENWFAPLPYKVALGFKYMQKDINFLALKGILLSLIHI